MLVFQGGQHNSDAAYVLHLQHDRIADLRDGRNACSLREWEQILTAFLLGGVPVKDAEAVADVEAYDKITVTIRRRVAGINQRLGTLDCRFAADPVVELFDWCDAAVQAAAEIKNELVAATARAQELEGKVDELKRHLAELEAAKKTEHVDLLARFRELLKEKKMKIAQQKRQLRAANLDPDDVKAEEEAEAAAAERSDSSERATTPDADADATAKSDNDDELPTRNSRPLFRFPF
ncbi:hypothetical protein P8C59_006936 [Phyllachora maydis]|uniref:Uncharacterized protein n=1 Tax=Phyllachora maydis TaxID=1825666 RepID=A0AAD9I7E8_9PEZI|nr:hypothetical protein P8C59_006936 [Phyllachora maydis]